MIETSLPSALGDHLGFHLRAVSNHVSHAFAARLAVHQVTVAEWVVLRTLYGAAPTAPSQVAADLGMTRGAITKLADRLIAKGLLVRAASPADGRAQVLALTAAGGELVPALAILADENDAAAFAPLDPAERAALAGLLDKLVAHHRIRTAPTE